MPERQSNIEFLTDLMEFNSPLVQIMVIDAVSKFADKIVAGGLEGLIAAGMNGESFISPEAWLETAKVIKSAFDERKESHQ